MQYGLQVADEICYLCIQFGDFQIFVGTIALTSMFLMHIILLFCF